MIDQKLVVLEDIIDKTDIENYTKFCCQCQCLLLVSSFFGRSSTCSSCLKTFKYSPVPFGNTMYDKLLRIIEFNNMRESINGYIEVQCQYDKCGKWFEATWYALNNRKIRINKDGCRLYCSDLCKSLCIVFGKSPQICRVCNSPFMGSTFSRYCNNCNSPERNRDGEVQFELRDLVLKRDDYTCLKCGAIEDLQCHHIEGIRYNPIESADEDLCITVCTTCHKEIHSELGCRFVDLRCETEME